MQFVLCSIYTHRRIIIRLLAHVYTQTNYWTNYLSLAQVRPDGSSVSSVNRAIHVLKCLRIFIIKLFDLTHLVTTMNDYNDFQIKDKFRKHRQLTLTSYESESLMGLHHSRKEGWLDRPWDTWKTEQ